MTIKQRIIKIFLPHDYYSDGLRRSCWYLFLLNIIFLLVGIVILSYGGIFVGILMVVTALFNLGMMAS